MLIICSRVRRGWDQTGSNGANLSFPQDLDVDFSNGGPNASRNQWIVGLINSAYVIYIKTLYPPGSDKALIQPIRLILFNRLLALRSLE